MPARRGLRAAAAALSATMAAAALAGCSVGAGASQHRTSSSPSAGASQHRTDNYSVSYSVSAPVQTLVVNAQVGDVHVIGGDSGRVSVTEHITFRGTAPRTTHRVTSGTLALDSNCPALEICSVGYVITVPRAMTVRVGDNVGAIRLQSLSGQVTAHTNVGDIDLGSVSGPIEVTGHAGLIRGQNVSSARATLRLSAGDIDVTFSAAPAAVTATTDVGAVTIRVPGGRSYAVNASALIGTTRISVTRDPASPHAITASTKTGAITIEPAA